MYERGRERESKRGSKIHTHTHTKIDIFTTENSRNWKFNYLKLLLELGNYIVIHSMVVEVTKSLLCEYENFACRIKLKTGLKGCFGREVSSYKFLKG